MKKAPNPEVDFTRFRRQISASSSKLLECQRAQLVKVTVPADSIVKALNAIKHVGFGFLAGSIDAPFVSFFLQAAEEGLGNWRV